MILMSLLEYQGELIWLEYVVYAAAVLGVPIAFLAGRQFNRGAACAIAYAYCLGVACAAGGFLMLNEANNVTDIRLFFYPCIFVGMLGGIVSAVIISDDSLWFLLVVFLLYPILEGILGALIIFATAIAMGAIKNFWVALVIMLCLFGGGGSTVAVIFVEKR